MADFFKNTGGTLTEQILEKRGEKLFLPLWSYPRVYRQAGKELCDLLAVMDDNIIIFSDKRRRFKLSEDDNVVAIDWNRWFKKTIVASARQLWGAEKWIKEHPDRIYRDGAAKHPLRLSCDVHSAKYHLIAIANGATNAIPRFFGKGDSSLLMINTLLRGDDDHLMMPEGKNIMPFQVGDIDPSKTFIHVFDEMGFPMVMKELDTSTDFINYLIKREELFRNRQYSIIAHGENCFLHNYIANMDASGARDFPYGRDALRQGVNVILDEGFIWNEHTSKQYFAKEKADEVSYLWDTIIATCIEENRTDFFVSESIGPHMLAIMARESRFARRMICDHFWGNACQVPRGKRWLGLSESPCIPGVVYVFAAISGATSEAQKDLLTAACVLALIDKFPHAHTCVGLSCGGKDDFLQVKYLHYCLNRESLTPDKIRGAREVQERRRIFKNVKITRKTEQEWPDA